MASNNTGPEEEKQKLMDGEEKPESKKSDKKDGTRVFKKASPNGKITVYLGRRDFVDHVTEVDPVDGVVLIDPDYFNKEGKKDRKVFAQVLAGFRYGRDDLDVLGLNFRRDLIDERIQVYPPPETSQPQLLTLLQVRLMKKLGRNAYPFTFSFNPGLPSSVSLQPAQGESEKPCGVDYILRCYVAKQPEDRIEKRNSVRLAIKKITHAPTEQTQRPSVEASKEFVMSQHPLHIEANLDKGTYYHGEPIKVNVALANRSSRSLRKIRLQVRQFATICLFAQSEYKCVVSQQDSDEGFPVSQGGTFSKTYELVPLLNENRDKRGLALDGQIKHEDTCLASSTILPPGTEETREVREKMGIMVHYSVKVRCVVAFGGDLTVELPFTLTHPKPAQPVISQMVTLPPRPSTSSAASLQEKGSDKQDGATAVPKGEEEEGEAGAGKKEAEEEGEDGGKAAAAVAVVPSHTSVHDAIDHNLISFDTDGGEDDGDFVFEEFVRLRVAGLDDKNETDA